MLKGTQKAPRIWRQDAEILKWEFWDVFHTEGNLHFHLDLSGPDSSLVDTETATNMFDKSFKGLELRVWWENIHCGLKCATGIIQKSRILLKSAFRKHREQLGELEQMCPSQLGNVASHTPVSTESLPCRFLEPQLRVLHHCGPKYTRHREKENMLEWECHGISGCGVSGHSLSSAEMHSQGLGAQRNWGGVAFLQN